MAKKKIQIEIFRAKNSQYAFRLKHRNGNILASSETYTRKANAMNGAYAFVRALRVDDYQFVDLVKKK